MTESPFIDSGFAVPMLSPRDHPIACLNKAMAFLTAVASLRFPSTNNQLSYSSITRNQATIQDGKTINPHNAAFQTEDLDTYDSDCDDLSNAQAVLMANISNYGSDVLSKDLYDFWKSRMELYMQNREHRRMILESVEHDPLIWPTVEENGVIRTKKYDELSVVEKIQADCDMKATNIILQVNTQSRNSGNDGRNTRRSYVKEEIIEGNNVYNDAGNIQRTLRTTSSGSATHVQCYNCSEKGHYARNCPKPRVRDSKYFMKQMLLAK
nr:hypothetical protein [Tanacetum cinerariifolium]